MILILIIYQKRFQVFNNENSITLNNEKLFDDFQNILKNVFTITKNRNVENFQSISQSARKNNDSQKIDKFKFKIIDVRKSQNQFVNTVKVKIIDVRESQNQTINIVKVFFKLFINISKSRLNSNKFNFQLILKIYFLQVIRVKLKRNCIFVHHLKKTTCVSIRKNYSSITF